MCSGILCVPLVSEAIHIYVIYADTTVCLLVGPLQLASDVV